MSKADAGRWGLRVAPERFRPLIADAAAHYAGEAEIELDRTEVTALVECARCLSRRSRPRSTRSSAGRIPR